MKFFDAEGRVGIIRFLLATLLALALLFACVTVLVRLPAATYPVIGAIAGLGLLAWGCEAARRLHDLGHTAWLLAIVAPLLALVALGLLLLYWVDTTAWIIGGGTAAAFALLFLRPGDRAANRFGAPPPQALSRGAATGTAPRLRPFVAVALACLAGAGIGFLLYTINQGMRAQSEWRARMTLVEPGAASASFPEHRA